MSARTLVPPPLRRPSAPRAQAQPLRRALVLLLLGLVGGLALLGMNPSAARAENTLEESSPAADDTVPPSLSQLTLQFANEITGSPLVVITCNGAGYQAGDAVLSGGTTVTVQLPTALPVTDDGTGTCSVVWRLTDATGNVDADGNFSFDVSSAAAADGAAAATSTDDDDATASTIGSASGASNGPIWLGRLASTFGVAVLFGALVLIVAAWPEGPEYVVTLKFLRTVWIVAIAGTVIYVIGLTAAVNGDSFGGGISPTGWFDLLDAGWGGRAALLRLVLVVASLWVVLRPERVIDPTTSMPAIAIPALAVLTLALTRTGGPLAALGVVASIAHVFAMAVWIGGVVLLFRVILAGPGEEDLVNAVQGFTRISTPAIVVVVVSGLIQMYRLDWGDLFSTGHGRVLLLKTLAVGVMIFVALTARQISRARLDRASELSTRTADRLRRAFGTEAAIGLLVLMITGWMLSFTPGKAPDSGSGDWAVERTIAPSADFNVDVSLRPGRVGLNDLRVEVNEPSDGLTGLTITFIPPDGSEANPIQGALALTGGSGSRVAATVDPAARLDFPVAGTWQVQVSGTTASGTAEATSSFTILNADGSTPAVGDVNVPPLPATTSTLADGPRLVEDSGAADSEATE